MPIDALLRSACSNNASESVVQFAGLSVIDRDNEAATAFQRHAHDDQSAFFNSLHWSVSGPRLHGCHVKSPFIGTRPIIPYVSAQ